MTTLAFIVGTLLSLFGGHAAGDTGITQLDQWTSTTTPSAAVTQRVWGKTIKITGLTTGLCLTLDSNKLLTTTACGSSGGTGVGTVATSSLETAGQIAAWSTSSGYPARLYSVATSTLTPSSPLTGSFVQIGSTGTLGIQAASASQNGYLSAADYSLLHTATTTAGTGLTYSGNAFNVNTSQSIATLSNLTSNGFVKTSGGTGTLSIDTNTYLTSAVTSVSGTTNQITSSGGNTPTLSFPSLIIQPNASTTLLSVFNSAYFGGSSTSTFGATGALALPNIANALKLPALGTAAGTFLAADPSGFIIATTTPSGGGTPANPSASVGLATINGSASTYMRSDAAPALSQSITPIWSALHIFSAGASSTQQSVFNKAYFGATATSTFDSAGVLTLASALGVGSGGLGIASTPAYGQIPVGNGTNYTLTATTSLGITGYTLFGGGAQGSPADATTYFIGGNVSVAFTIGTTDGEERIYFPKAGTVKDVRVYISKGGVAGTAETSTMSFRLNGTTDTTISSAVTTSSTFQSFDSGALSINVTSSDYLEIKWVTPTWVTNPTNIRIWFVVYIE